MLQPNVTYRHSEQARATARRVRSMKSEFTRLSKSQLRDLIRSLGGLADDEQTLPVLRNLARALADDVFSESAEDFSLAMEDPDYKLQALFARVNEIRTEAEAKYEKHREAATDPRFFNWSAAGHLIESSARVRACHDVLRWEGTGKSYDDIVAEVTYEVVRMARSGTHRYTSAVSNVLEEAYLSALADLVERHQY